jgi:hypothetical protein
MKKFDYSANKTITLWIPPQVMEKLQSKKKVWTHLVADIQEKQQTSWFVDGVRIRMKKIRDGNVDKSSRFTISAHQQINVDLEKLLRQIAKGGKGIDKAKLKIERE